MRDPLGHGPPASQCAAGSRAPSGNGRPRQPSSSEAAATSRSFRPSTFIGCWASAILAQLFWSCFTSCFTSCLQAWHVVSIVHGARARRRDSRHGRLHSSLVHDPISHTTAQIIRSQKVRKRRRSGLGCFSLNGARCRCTLMTSAPMLVLRCRVRRRAECVVADRLSTNRRSEATAESKATSSFVGLPGNEPRGSITLRPLPDAAVARRRSWRASRCCVSAAITDGST